MARLKVDIVTPERRLAQLEADEVIAPGALGLFGVRPGHASFLSVMNPGLVTVREGTATTKYFVAGGFAEVGPAHVRLLADFAEDVKEMDLDKAQKALASAEAKLKALPPADPRTEDAQALVAREAKRVEIARAR